MIGRPFADAFAAEWIAAWNTHNLDRILAHYAPGFTFSSPRIAEVVGEPSATLTGHPAMRAYWARALRLQPALHFELVNVFAGVQSLVIHYRRDNGTLAAEHFEFAAGGQVLRSSAHY